MLLTDLWRTKYRRSTLYALSGALRRVLRHLEYTAGAPVGIHTLVPKAPPPVTRLVVATDDERARLLALAPAHLRAFIHLTADLGLRHATATALTLAAWDPATSTITFITKHGQQQTLPLTPELSALFGAFSSDTARNVPIIALLAPHRLTAKHPHAKTHRYLYRSWNKLKELAGVRDCLNPHDLRRSAAEAIYAATKDIRMAQALLGHQNPNTTGKYLGNRVDTDRLRAPLLEATAARNRKEFDA